MIFPNASILDRRSLAAEAHAVANDAALYGAAEGDADEQQAAFAFVATGLPAVAEEGFALEVAVELVGELDAEVLEYAVFHCVWLLFGWVVYIFFYFFCRIVLWIGKIVVSLRLKSGFPSYRKAYATLRRRRENCFLLFI